MTTEVKAAGMGNTYRSDQQKKNDRVGMDDHASGGSIARRDGSDKATDIAEDVSHKAKEAGETIKDKVSDIGHSLQETGHNLSEKSKHSHKAMCDFTKENPTVAVLIAFGLGTLVSRILPGR